jgi:hypothetical protein
LFQCHSEPTVNDDQEDDGLITSSKRRRTEDITNSTVRDDKIKCLQNEVREMNEDMTCLKSVLHRELPIIEKIAVGVSALDGPIDHRVSHIHKPRLKNNKNWTDEDKNQYQQEIIEDDDNVVKWKVYCPWRYTQQPGCIDSCTILYSTHLFLQANNISQQTLMLRDHLKFHSILKWFTDYHLP